MVRPSARDQASFDVSLSSADWRRRLRRALLTWFNRSSRDLPWRRDRDPYRIWVSEIMLQQTQVATVVGYFERFLQAFPTVADLAAADEQDVLRLWEGLGYYRRARDLHRAAQHIVHTHGGTVPRSEALLSALPGIGRYTMGAILSQAFDQRLPILEANSERVLCRLFALRADPRRGPGRRWLWEAAERLLPRRRVGAFNQALMELGALVCTPTAPRCGACPVAELCAARQLGLQEALPIRGAAPEPIVVHEAGVVVRRGPRVLLVQRPAEGRWAGLWEFPHEAVKQGQSHETAARQLLERLTGLRAELGPELLTVRHSVTHHRITLVCFEARCRGGRFHSAFYRQGRWVKPEELVGFPLSRPARRIAQQLLQPERQANLF